MRSCFAILPIVGTALFLVPPASPAQAANLDVAIDPAAVLGPVSATGPIALNSFRITNHATVNIDGPASPSSVNFSIQGFLEVTGYNGPGGGSISDPKLNVPAGYGLYFQYMGGGFQSTTPTIVDGNVVLPTTYTSLSADLFAFDEPAGAVSTFAPDGTTINQPGTSTTLLATGQLADFGFAALVNGLPRADQFLNISIKDPAFFVSVPSSVYSVLEVELQSTPDNLFPNGPVLIIEGENGTAAFVPEPASLVLLGFGLAALLAARSACSI